MRQKLRRRGALATLSLVTIVLVNCDSGGGEATEDASVDLALRSLVLANLGENVILPTLRTFAEDAVELSNALASASNGGDLVAARQAWTSAMQTWELVEMMQVGPTGAMDLTSGGEDRRDYIYAWPLRNLCAIDQRTASADYATTSVLSEDLVSTRGLGAVGYLLFVETNDNTCSPLSPINAEGTWAALSAEEIRQRRTLQAAELAKLVQSDAAALLARWEADDGNFISELTEPRRSGALYGSAQEGLNAVSDAMFYIYDSVRDMKVGEPAGIIGCTESVCPEAVEFPYASFSVQAVTENLLAFQSLYRGGDESSTLGFDDLLIAMKAEVFAQSMGSHIEEAITAVSKIDGPLQEAVVNDAADVEAAHAAIALVVVDLKTMFLSVLDLEIPNRAAGDND